MSENEPIGRESIISMRWNKVSIKPPTIDTLRGYRECRNILVWIEDERHRCFTRGGYIEFHDGEGEFFADGFSGGWNITHWMIVDSPNEN